ncbi:hypothetical protein PQE72_gp036 [Bacillus phage vB_BanS_Skywalker]|uniref:Uncharacterized protein n=2 Tax=Tsamsavirus TaxID=3044849 RepID=A0AAE9CEY0_9CAUD|nr:hypothetical protein PQE72_gp036 [Bacillus phage vB_BanS_Skywalker]YP_010680904.1 hypothetical protein PQE73_gp008 [Bacillus phage vB_BanS_MrDarsey]UGO47840.1 hypothetical protein MRDARSEY_8 [Bacillus phage vB_BanS_MrDarsey]UGO51407.1 hypothetical protein SKYWALKER_250 [Bacillus phage vB_BanS_Skywalker]
MKSKEYRMAQMQVRNIVNIGIANGVPLTDIQLLAMATIDACQLFIEDKEIAELRIDLYNRLKSVKVFI